MTQLLLHGPAKSASRNKLVELKRRFDQNSVVVYEEGTDLQIIKGSLVTSSLFSGQQLIVLENPPEELANYTLYPIPYPDKVGASSAYTLVLWFDHEVDTKKWPGFEALFFPEAKEVSVFPFLDFLAAQDQKAFLEMEKLKNAGFDIHYCLTMVFYLLRNLIATPKNAPDFVRKKLARQRIRFNRENIKNLYKDLLEIDFKFKSGLLEKPQAEFMLVDKFTGRLTP